MMTENERELLFLVATEILSILEDKGHWRDMDIIKHKMEEITREQEK